MNAHVYLVVGLLLSTATLTHGYCKPEDISCWPSNEVWTSELGSSLSSESSLIKFTDSSKNVCEIVYFDTSINTNAYVYGRDFDGVCAQTTNCNYEYCDSKRGVNTPAYSVKAKTEADVQAALIFANKYNISVTVKSTGHDYSGSSSGKGSLRIWMWYFEKFSSKGLVSHTDSCGTVNNHAVKVGGGEIWTDVYTNVGESRHVVGGSCGTVSATGGWLQGVGLSSTARNYGFGVDNVLDFRVVLANGTIITADTCTNPDIFWALRGGGGGTFGVVTHVHYRTHELKTLTAFNFDIPAENYLKHSSHWESFIDFWVDNSPDADKRLGGYWGLTFFYLTFVGTQTELKTSNFYTAFENWYNNLPQKNIFPLTLEIKEYDSYLEQKGGKEAIINDRDAVFGGWLTDRTGYETGIASRLFSKQFVKQESTFIKEKLKALAWAGVPTFSYFLGGVTEELIESPTSINPQFRTACWQINTVGADMPNGARHVRTMAEYDPNSNSGGAGRNHAAKDEPNWRTNIWGNESYAKLVDIKHAVDPENRFNCFHCVDYQGEEGPQNNGSFMYSLPFSSSNKSFQPALFALVVSMFATLNALAS